MSGRRLRLVTVLVVVFTACTSAQPSPTPSPSPAGKGKIVYLRGCCMASVIHTVDPDGSDVKQLGSYDTDWLFGPEWSPDGSTIAYSDGNGGGIFTMNADGSERTPVGGNGWSEDPAWSPDGTHIAYAQRGTAQVEGGIMVMAADGSGRTRLTSGPANDTDPTWSPDGSSILFLRHSQGEVGFFTIAPDGTNLKQLFRVKGDITSSEWLPDGSGLIFDWTGQVCRYYLSDGRVDTLFDGLDPAVSPDGTRLVWVRLTPAEPASSHYELVVSDIAGGNAATIVRCETDCRLGEPDWGPLPPAASASSPTKAGPLVDETATVPPVLPDTVNGQAKQPTDRGSNFTDGQASPGSDCCIGARYGEDQGVPTYVLVLLRRPIGQALTPSDALREFLGGNASDTHVAVVGDVAYSCSQVKTVDPSEPVTGSCVWADEALFGTLEFFDSTEPPAMWSLTAKVQQEVAGLNQSP
jgi:hypothetical protein